MPIGAKLVANLIATAGAHRVLTMDLHAAQIQGFFDIPVDHLYAAPVVVGYYQANPMPNLTVVAPDTGGAERARAYAKRLKSESGEPAALALCDKRREKANVAEVMNVVGDVRGRNCLIVDDMCDTGGSLTKVARALKEAGAARIHASFTHAVLSGSAVEHLAKSDIEQIVTTNTIPLSDKAHALPGIKVLSIAPMLAKAIKSIHEETSVSSLFV
ncbi:MAG: ribose-phosphate diphosphokinase [Pyrinomonadaceae bacterium]